jgi:hypothetical protein
VIGRVSRPSHCLRRLDRAVDRQALYRQAQGLLKFPPADGDENASRLGDEICQSFLTPQMIDPRHYTVAGTTKAGRFCSLWGPIIPGRLAERAWRRQDGFGWDCGGRRQAARSFRSGREGRRRVAQG